jgi:hypothetical protein
MRLATVHDVHMAINLAHRFVYFVPEAAEEYAALGITGRSGYFASRAAPLGPVSDPVIVATFYNFHPRAVATATPGIWEAASPDAWQAARYRAAQRALHRVGVTLTAAEISEARAIIDPVVAGADLAGKPLAAANVAMALPEDPLTALWQQVTILREWRGDAHIALLVTHEISPAECMVLQVGTGRFPMAAAKASRQWDAEEWATAIGKLAVRGWVDDTGTMTAAGVEAREQLETDTDRLCAALWATTDAESAARLADLLTPIHTAMDAAGTYAALA